MQKGASRRRNVSRETKPEAESRIQGPNPTNKETGGKAQDTALCGKARGKVPASHVLVYSYGDDEMWRKVRASALVKFDEAELEKPYMKGELGKCCRRTEQRREALR